MKRRIELQTPAKPIASVDAVTDAVTPWWRNHRLWLLLVAVVSFAVVLGIYVLRLDQTVGMFVDDAWYVLLAKALATGHGFTLINSPSPGILPLYPPGFPAVLSIVFRFAPDFPQNLWLLKSVSIAAMLAASFVTYWYFRRGRQTPSYFALALALAFALTPPLVFLSASTLMSEPFFVLSLMLTVTTIEYGVQRVKRERMWLYALLASVFASLAFLTRSVGVALIAGVVLYLFKERHWRAIAVFVAGVALVAGPWMIYSRLHAPTMEQRKEQNGSIVQGYSSQFWVQSAGSPRSGNATVGDLPERAWKNATTMMMRDAGEMLLAKIFYLMQESDSGAGGLSFVLGLLCIAGYISAVRQRVTLAEIVVPLSLIVVLLWPWESFRFVLPITAFALFYLLLGFRAIYNLHLRLRQEPRQPAWKGLTFLAILIIVAHLYANIGYIQLKRSALTTERPDIIKNFEENLGVLNWMKERLPADSVVASNNPALVRLFTGLKTVASDDPKGNWDTWNRIGVRYLAYISLVTVSEPDLAESRYKVIHRPRSTLNLRVVDLGEPGTREAWGYLAPRQMQMIN